MNTKGSGSQAAQRSAGFRALRMLGTALLWLVVTLLTLWAVAALYVDFRVPWLRVPITVVYILAIVVILFRVKRRMWAAALCLAGFCIVLAWWLSLKPSNDGDWQADAARTASVDIDGDRVTIHNLRNCHYVTKKDYSDCWSDRTVYLSQLRHVDLFFTTWGPKYIGHPILSFQFGDNDHIAVGFRTAYQTEMPFMEGSQGRDETDHFALFSDTAQIGAERAQLLKRSHS